MSVLADIYISLDSEAVKYDAAPVTFTERAQFKRITPLELSTLWAIIRGIEWDGALIDDFACLFQVDGGERLIHSFPAAMVTTLGRLTDEQIRDCSAKWAATEELSCSPSEIQPIVEAISRLACSAASSGRGLFIWNCI